MGITTTALVAAFGAKYADEGQNLRENITKQLFEPTKADGFFQLRPTKSDIFKGAYAEVSSILQAFHKNFNANGDLTFKPMSIELGEFKIDASMFPDDVKNSYAGFLQQLEKPERKNWDMVSWFIKEMAIPKMREEYEKDVVWRGWKFDGTFNGTPTVNGTTFQRQLKSADTANPANATMDGIWLQILRNLSRVNVINTGALDANDVTFVGQVEAFARGIAAPLRAKIDYIFMSEDNYLRYIDGVKEKYNKYYAQEQDLTKIAGTSIKVEWLRGMDDSDKIWGTPEMNRVRPTHTDNDGLVDVQAEKRAVNILHDHKKAIGFLAPELVVTNDLENSITAQNITDYYTEA